jgi:hypothetical protein
MCQSGGRVGMTEKLTLKHPINNNSNVGAKLRHELRLSWRYIKPPIGSLIMMNNLGGCG